MSTVSPLSLDDLFQEIVQEMEALSDSTPKPALFDLERQLQDHVARTADDDESPSDPMCSPDTKRGQDALHEALDAMVKTIPASDDHPEQVVADLERQLLYLIALTGDDDDPSLPPEDSNEQA